MTNSLLVENKISVVKKYLKNAQYFKKYSQKEIEKRIELRGSVERYLYLAVQSTIDLAEAVVTDKNFRKPSSMRESFNILEEEKIISQAMVKKMTDMVGFRNIMAHDYEKTDFSIVCDVLNKKLSDIEKFLKVIEKL